MKELFTGLYTKFKSSPTSDFYTAIGGRLYLYNAPQNATLPYAVYSRPTASTDYSFTSTFEFPSIQFDLFSKAIDQNADEINNMRNYCCAQFDDCVLTVTGYDFLRMERSFENGPFKESDLEIWRWTIGYDVWLAK